MTDDYGGGDGKIIEAYLEYLRVERRLSDVTIKRHLVDLERLFLWANHKPLTTLAREDVEQFLEVFDNARGTVRGFFRFLVLDRRIDVSPAPDAVDPVRGRSRSGSTRV